MRCSLLWLVRAGTPWADLPERFGKPDTVRKRFRRLAQKGSWKGGFEALQEPDLDWVMLDSTVVRAHQHAAGQKKTAPACLPKTPPLAVVGGGRLSTKIHACTDALGQAIGVLVTAGQAGDSPQFSALLAGVKPKMVIADTSYESDITRLLCNTSEAVAVMPNRPNRVEPLPLDEA